MTTNCWSRTQYPRRSWADILGQRMQENMPNPCEVTGSRALQGTNSVAAVNCHRCKGLMCPAELRDWESGSRQDYSDALRCISCEEIVDPVIVSNRIGALGGRTGPRKGRARHSVQVVPV